MIIKPLPGQTIRLPLDTAFTLDLTELLPPETFIYGFYLNLLEELPDSYNMLSSQVGEDGRTILIIPNTTWTGVPAPEGDTAAIAGEMVFYTNGEGPLSLGLTATLDPRDSAAQAQGTAGRDTILFDAQDPGMGTTYLVDTSGGSDRAQITNGAAVMLGRSGDDTLTGWNGNDALYGGGGNDALYGGAGIDRLMGMNGDDVLFGGADNDFVNGGSGNDSVVGGAGNDTLQSGGGQDTVRGEAGNDRIGLYFYAPGTDPLAPASLLAYGGDGNDTFETSMFMQPARASTLDVGEQYGDTGFVTLHGGNGNDEFYVGGTRGGDLFGGADNDTLSGSVAEGLEGTLRFYGGAGDDGLYGGTETQAWGGTGADTIFVGNAATAWGGDGDDSLTLFTDYSTNVGGTIFGGAGNDVLYMGAANDTGHGGEGDDEIYGGAGLDMLYGGIGTDSLYGGQDADLLSGGDGADTLVATDDDLFTPSDYLDGLGTKNDTLFGGAGNDALSASRAGHALYGGSGNDTLSLAINTSLSGGRTLLDGGIGNDTLRSQGLTDAIGGEGEDRFVANVGNTIVEHEMVITDFVRGTDRLAIEFSNGNAQGNTSSFIFMAAGNGTEDFVASMRTVTWQQEDGGSRVFIDYDGDRTSDGSIFIQGAADVTAADFEPFFSFPPF
jgi:Ca2+-binding RTX toxin-like protein